MLRVASVQEFQSWSHKSMKMESGAATLTCNALEAFLEAGPHGLPQTQAELSKWQSRVNEDFQSPFNLFGELPH